MIFVEYDFNKFQKKYKRRKITKKKAVVFDTGYKNTRRFFYKRQRKEEVTIGKIFN